MEIERKFLIDKIPESIDLSGLKCRRIEQGYLCTEPVVRVRRDNDDCYLTYKSKGLMVREEYNLPLTRAAYDKLIKKADGNIICFVMNMDRKMEYLDILINHILKQILFK